MQDGQCLLSLLQGIGETLALASVSLTFGLVLGIVLSLYQKQLKTVFVILQSLPELLILFSVYFGMGWVINLLFPGGEASAFFSACFTLSLIFGSYSAKIFFAAYHQVSVEDKNVALTLRLSKTDIFWHIVLPQLWRHALPGLGSLWLILLKDTAIISLIGGQDLMSRTQILVRNSGEPFVYYSILAGIYLCLTLASEKIIKKGAHYA